MNSPAYIVAQYLINEGVLGDPLGTSLEWPLYHGHLPDHAGLPDDVAATYDTEGVKDGRLMSGPNVVHHGLQVIVRALSSQEGWSKIHEVCAALEAINAAGVTIDSVDYTIVNVSQRGTIMSMGLEGGTKRRSLFSVNFTVTLGS